MSAEAYSKKLKIHFYCGHCLDGVLPDLYIVKNNVEEYSIELKHFDHVYTMEPEQIKRQTIEGFLSEKKCGKCGEKRLTEYGTFNEYKYFINDKSRTSINIFQRILSGISFCFNYYIDSIRSLGLPVIRRKGK